MKVVIVSNPNVVENETTIISALFEAGLETLHLRKPDITKDDLVDLINCINPKYHPAIVLHQHFDLTEEFAINRIHLSEPKRKTASSKDLLSWKSKNYVLSTSIHSIEDYNSLSTNFDYVFLGPVYESISKDGYKPSFNILEEVKLLVKKQTQIFAIGGVAPDKLEELEESNFDGAALLGSIWTNPKNAINIFKACSQNVNM